MIEQRRDRPFAQTKINEGVISDEEVNLKASDARWRLIRYETPEGTCPLVHLLLPLCIEGEPTSDSLFKALFWEASLSTAL